MTVEIKNLISNCSTCIKYSNSQQNKSIINRLTRLWQIIAGDIFEIKGHYYLYVPNIP